MNDKLQFETFYPHPPRSVWKALTDPEALGRWLMPVNFKAEVGHRFRFEDKGKPRSPIDGVVLEVETEFRLSYSWDDGEAGSPSVVRWTLSPSGDGTTLRLEHLAETADLVSTVEAELNWGPLVHVSLSSYLNQGRQPVPIVYVQGEPERESKRRAGFRQEAGACS